jgi:L-iditol 2-dehydrogenase
MKAFVKYGKNPYEAGLCEIPAAEPGPEDVLLRVAGCGICGSDLHAYRASYGYEWVQPPVTLGHEFAGTVEAVGSAVGEFAAGDTVVVIGIQGCGLCRYCRSGDTNRCYDRKVIGLDMNGGMATHAVVNRRHLIRLAPGIDPALAALVEPLSVAVHALSRVEVRPALKAVVTGPGPIGLLCAAVAARSGAEVLVCGTSTDEGARLPAARRLGFAAVNTDQVALPEAVAGHCAGEPPELWIEASGATAALETSIRLLGRGGDLLVVGMYAKEFTFFPSTAVRAELRFSFAYASTYRDYRKAVDLLRANAVDLQALAQFHPLDRAEEAFREAEAGRTLKPILVP